ncbi:MAG: coenzyme F420-0:L-glutamate ligase [Firmicutes bacterium]|nr:coenzyme F420-0:L-glutamate ligase [Bacillota bacterium]
MQLIPVKNIPIIDFGTDLKLSTVVIKALRDQSLALKEKDVLVIAHTLVSKIEGRVLNLRDVTPGLKAEEIAKRTGKDPALVEVILRESKEIVKEAGPVLIAESRCGSISANAGVDQSNAGPFGQDQERWVVLLPENPDQSAQDLLQAVRQEFSVQDAGVIISDTQGRPFRVGAVGVALGAAGIKPLADWRGHKDLYGRELLSSEEAVADELASAATILMGQSSEGIPLVVVRNAPIEFGTGSAVELARPKEKDIFRAGPK